MTLDEAIAQTAADSRREPWRRTYTLLAHLEHVLGDWQGDDTSLRQDLELAKARRCLEQAGAHLLAAFDRSVSMKP